MISFCAYNAHVEARKSHVEARKSFWTLQLCKRHVSSFFQPVAAGTSSVTKKLTSLACSARCKLRVTQVQIRCINTLRTLREGGTPDANMQEMRQAESNSSCSRPMRAWRFCGYLAVVVLAVTAFRSFSQRMQLGGLQGAAELTSTGSQYCWELG